MHTGAAGSYEPAVPLFGAHMALIRSLNMVVALSLLSACATAATAGAAGLRMASMGRIQATPFSDQIATRSCRDELTKAIGFTHQTHAEHNGVYAVQSFECRANQLFATVSLNNRSDDPMFCFAESDVGIQGVHVPPRGVGFFEYSFSHSAHQSCELAD